MRASGKLLLDARICALQRKIESPDSDIEVLIGAYACRGGNAARSDCVRPCKTGSGRTQRVCEMKSGRLRYSLKLPMARVLLQHF